MIRQQIYNINVSIVFFSISSFGTFTKTEKRELKWAKVIHPIIPIMLLSAAAAYQIIVYTQCISISNTRALGRLRNQALHVRCRYYKSSWRQAKDRTHITCTYHCRYSQDGDSITTVARKRMMLVVTSPDGHPLNNEYCVGRMTPDDLRHLSLLFPRPATSGAACLSSGCRPQGAGSTVEPSLWYDLEHLTNCHGFTCAQSITIVTIWLPQENISNSLALGYAHLSNFLACGEGHRGKVCVRQGQGVWKAGARCGEGHRGKVCGRQRPLRKWFKTTVTCLSKKRLIKFQWNSLI